MTYVLGATRLPTDREQKDRERARWARAVCYRCGRDLPLQVFAVDRTKKSGRSSICRECDRVKSRDYYEANRERKLAQSAERRARHRRQRFCECGAPTWSQRSRYCRTHSEAAATRRRFRKRVA
jgi:hypothetical protein